MFLRYALVSAGCLLVDFGVFLAGLALGSAPAAAGAVGYLCGAAAHYFLSAGYVFPSGHRRFSHMRAVECSLYLLTALVGTGLTAVVILAVLMLAPGAAVVAKVIAVFVTFATVYLVRARLLMRDAAVAQG